MEGRGRDRRVGEMVGEERKRKLGRKNERRKGGNVQTGKENREKGENEGEETREEKRG